jgi:hypothetical protein
MRRARPAAQQPKSNWPQHRRDREVYAASGQPPHTIHRQHNIAWCAARVKKVARRCDDILRHGTSMVIPFFSLHFKNTLAVPASLGQKLAFRVPILGYGAMA